jgi:hypothetical protein
LLRLAPFSFLLAIGFAHDPITTKLTWSSEISRIVYKRCASCHHEGGSAMSLVTYDEARPWAKAIRDQVLERQMPPWGAVRGVGQFKDDPSLSQPEMEMIVNWVEGGAPKGDDALLPHVPSFQPPAAENWHPDPRNIPVSHNLVLKSQTTVAGIRPQFLKTGQSLEVTAYLPDGEVEHLIWLRNYRKEWTRTYAFLQPITLPKDTDIRVSAGDGSRALLIVR